MSRVAASSAATRTGHVEPTHVIMAFTKQQKPMIKQALYSGSQSQKCFVHFHDDFPYDCMNEHKTYLETQSV